MSARQITAPTTAPSVRITQVFSLVSVTFTPRSRIIDATTFPFLFNWHAPCNVCSAVAMAGGAGSFTRWANFSGKAHDERGGQPSFILRRTFARYGKTGALLRWKDRLVNSLNTGIIAHISTNPAIRRRPFSVCDVRSLAGSRYWRRPGPLPIRPAPPGHCHSAGRKAL